MKTRVLIIVSLVLTATLLAVPSQTSAGGFPAVTETRILGYSVQGRAIRAWRLGDPNASRKAVIISTMHGNEDDTYLILNELRGGDPIRGIDVWVVPKYNPDGYARRSRKNARGVDLNRNYPHGWRDLDGSYESGPRAISEPETRAMMRFLDEIKPRYLISFHQPLYGVDLDTKSPYLARKLIWHLELPGKRFTCGGVCHGTMTSWYNFKHPGYAITVEYGRSPSRWHLTRRAPDQLLKVLTARR
ncbi:MAG TPA: M14 family zinc carboxypeptidase [Nocardioides sp.]